MWESWISECNVMTECSGLWYTLKHSKRCSLYVMSAIAEKTFSILFIYRSNFHLCRALHLIHCLVVAMLIKILLFSVLFTHNMSFVQDVCEDSFVFQLYWCRLTRVREVQSAAMVTMKHVSGERISINSQHWPRAHRPKPAYQKN